MPLLDFFTAYLDVAMTRMIFLVFVYQFQLGTAAKSVFSAPAEACLNIMGMSLFFSAKYTLF